MEKVEIKTTTVKQMFKSVFLTVLFGSVALGVYIIRMENYIWITLFLVLMFLLFVYIIVQELKLRKLKIIVSDLGIEIIHSNGTSYSIKWENIQEIGVQPVVKFLKPIPEAEGNFVIKLKNSNDYNFLDLKIEKRLLKLKKDFANYLGDKSFDIWISFRSVDDDSEAIPNLIKKLGKTIHTYKPLVKTTDQAVYDKIYTKYFEKDSKDNQSMQVD